MNLESSPLFVLYAGTRNLALVFDSVVGIELKACEDPDRCPVLTRRPDIILMDPPPIPGDKMNTSLALQWLKAFKAIRFRFSPAFFTVVCPEIDMDEEMDLMESGFDDVVKWPVSPRVLEVKSRCHVKKTLMEQSLQSNQAALEKAFGYLDRFKGELGRLKKDLRDEKDSLNTALKQVQQMTLERRRLKTCEATLKDVLGRNMDGFGNILHTLIQHQVEKDRGHGERVARIAVFIAKEMGIGEKKLEDLRKAAMLHEIGLLFLSKPHWDGSLDSLNPDLATEIQPDVGDQENKSREPGAYDETLMIETLMIQFPVKGAQLLNHCPGFEGPAQIIYALNENSDGSGYPDGLTRRYIPLASKILAGADELESLKDREDIRGVDSVLVALEDLAGVRLDPVIVGWLEKYVVLHMGVDDFRVRGVGIEQLKPDMELGTAVFTTTGTKLFTANTVLTRELIDKIIQYHREYPVDATVYIKV